MYHASENLLVTEHDRICNIQHLPDRIARGRQARRNPRGGSGPKMLEGATTGDKLPHFQAYPEIFMRICVPCTFLGFLKAALVP